MFIIIINIIIIIIIIIIKIQHNTRTKPIFGHVSDINETRWIMTSK